jgi:murein L,D-transpeptidase YafK
MALFGLAGALLLSCAARLQAQEGVPASASHDKQTRSHGFFTGSPILIRIFKEESQLEVWMENGARFHLLATYPICFWSGTLGPKEYEGDRQAPEGFYTVSAHQLIVSGKHARSLDIGFPNSFDRSLGRTGSHILLHGGCRSTGCFAMTDAVMDRLYGLAEQALRAGQTEIQVHIFPFRLTEANLQRHSTSRWVEFWNILKQGYDAFETTRAPPALFACGGVYRVGEATNGIEAAQSEECPPPAPPLAVAMKRRVGISALPPRTLPTRVRAAATPSAFPRDNVAECLRLWKPETRVSHQYWMDICKKLDFQPRRTVRSAHRSS